MSLASLAPGYRAAARHLRKQLKLLRARCRATEDPGERLILQRRINTLEPILTEMNALAELTAHYYDRGYHKDEDYSL